MQVKDIMTEQVISISPEENVRVAARLLAQHNVGILPVCGPDKKLRGMITDRDIVLRCVAADEDPGELTVQQIMTRRLVSASPEEPAEQAAHKMAQEQVRRLPVEQDGKLVGMLSLADLAEKPACSMEAAEALCDICANVHRA